MGGVSAPRWQVMTTKDDVIEPVTEAVEHLEACAQVVAFAHFVMRRRPGTRLVSDTINEYRLMYPDGQVRYVRLVERV